MVKLTVRLFELSIVPTHCTHFAFLENVISRYNFAIKAFVKATFTLQLRWEFQRMFELISYLVNHTLPCIELCRTFILPNMIPSIFQEAYSLLRKAYLLLLLDNNEIKPEVELIKNQNS